MLARSLAAASRAAVRAVHTTAAVRAEAGAAAATAGKEADLTLNFAIPHMTILSKKVVSRVTLPGRDGAFGIEKNSPAFLSELRPGVVKVEFADASAAEEYFVPGGFCFKHPNNIIDVSAPEGVKLDSIDTDALRAANAEAVKARDAATPGSAAYAEAKVTLELYRILSQAAKVTL